MSVLAHAHHAAYGQAPRPIRQPGAFRRLLGRFLQWRQRRVEEDIAIHLGLSGGHPDERTPLQQRQFPELNGRPAARLR